MKHLIETSRFAYSLVSYYSKYDETLKQFTLDRNDIPDFDLHDLSSKIMSDNKEFAAEATGPDNPHYETSMLPALIRHLSDTTDAELRHEFNEAWQAGITAYCTKTTEALLMDETINYNFDKGCRKWAA